MQQNHSLIVLNPESKTLIRQAINGEKILSALNAYALTMDVVLSNKASQQISVIRKIEEENVLIFIATLVKEFSRTVRTVWGADDENQNTQQKYIDVAVQMMNEYYYWKLEEFAVFFRNAMKGIYERPMGNVDMECLFIMGDQYSNARAEYLQRQIHNETFGDPNRKPIAKPDEIQELEIKKIFQDLKKKFSSYTPTNFQKKKNDICQFAMREFDDLHRKQSKDYTCGQRYVTYNEKMLSESEYLQIRFDELYKK